ncbi:putative signal peptide protein [Acidisarcina polymorpha]|uniref:Putative signal peptide protein n=1 Tax=Acidisarcina polymorpha TaxID=2211140 RepID=A0A2Z5FTW7_9BACT|nr:alpha/beta hydrolase [Acidisarcina polymorpha]AXC10288.1 putative signal peptide protein [Acidisarcina polymorpha]
MTSSPQAGTVVLVHGAWADGSCWSNVVLPLIGKGFHVTAAPLPLTTLAEDTDILHRAIERAIGPVVLVGHAYAGAVIAAVQDDRVKSLVYIAALAPDEGETVADVFYRTPSHPQAPQLAPDSYGLIWMPGEGFGNAVAHQATADQLAIMAAVQRPISVNCIQEKAPVPQWKTKPSWYLIAEDDRMINPKTQRFMAGRMNATIRSHTVDHTPMYSAPDKVIDIVLEAANATLS